MGVTPTEKGFRLGKVEVNCCDSDSEGEGGLYGMICVCEGSKFNGEGGIREFGEENEGLN